MASSGGIPHVKVCKTVGCAALTHPTGGASRVSQSILNEANVLAMQVESGKEDTAVAERILQPERSQIREGRRKSRIGPAPEPDARQPHDESRDGRNEGDDSGMSPGGGIPHASVCKPVGCAALTHPTGGSSRVIASSLNEANDLAMQVESGKEDTAVAERNCRPERTQSGTRLGQDANGGGGIGDTQKGNGKEDEKGGRKQKIKG